MAHSLDHSQPTKLLQNFLETVGNDRHEEGVNQKTNVRRFVDSFKILLEEKYGVPPSERGSFSALWQKVEARAGRYHAPRSSDFHSITRMEEDVRLEQDVLNLIQEYDRILHSDVETPHNPTIGKLRTRFGSEEMHGI